MVAVWREATDDKKYVGIDEEIDYICVYIRFNMNKRHR